FSESRVEARKQRRHIIRIYRPAAAAVGVAEPASAGRCAHRTCGLVADLSPLSRVADMTLVLVRKLLRDVRWGLLVVAVLLCLFQALWVKVTQRISTQMSPMFQAMARMQGMEVKEMEKQLFSGTGRIAQSIIGGEQLRYEKAMDVLSIGFMHPLVQAIFC